MHYVLLIERERNEWKCPPTVSVFFIPSFRGFTSEIERMSVSIIWWIYAIQNERETWNICDCSTSSFMIGNCVRNLVTSSNLSKFFLTVINCKHQSYTYLFLCLKCCIDFWFVFISLESNVGNTSESILRRVLPEKKKQ